METLRDKLWVWGHLPGSHNKLYGINSAMSAVEAAEYLGARNAFMISLGGNLKPPFDNYSRALSVLREVKYSIVGDAGSPENGANLGDLNEVRRQANLFDNITGGMFDDFYSEKRMAVYTPKVLKAIRDSLHNNEKPLDMWSVIYDRNLSLPKDEYIDMFDGLSFWTWDPDNLKKFDENYDRFLSLTKNKRRMLGCYLYSYGKSCEMAEELGVWQMEKYTECIRRGEVEGIIFCSNTVADLGYSAVEAVKEWVSKQANKEI